MGWYRTCSICGTQGKGGLFCDCMSKQSDEIEAKIVGMTLVRKICVRGACGHSYEFWFDPKNDTTLVVVHNRDVGGEMGSDVEFEPFEEKDITGAIQPFLKDDWYKVQEISADGQCKYVLTD